MKTRGEHFLRGMESFDRVLVICQVGAFKAL